MEESHGFRAGILEPGFPGPSSLLHELALMVAINSN